ncbi:uncharacterized protein LACBIDRAFT_299854 [Laccaria bicolor S238N-H82]|uniref:Predicted protein n=1 Tax=Laccaria bicolor (strain S238N-H82 / ATCC MYA-4686) TaxID=486041 RepID=B0DFK7_LACBS|nr:uncharacterized protein LACBIDRAFT_299854 [Laccaria bicolor S238N-H82]EDR06882.1 predicted protein [Laccaria bicolor S238N-H82]|eukprot:XP_001882729.1 predicted protein [Laccaria bicolor S238N-H82]
MQGATGYCCVSPAVSNPFVVNLREQRVNCGGGIKMVRIGGGRRVEQAWPKSTKNNKCFLLFSTSAYQVAWYTYPIMAAMNQRI